MRLPPQPPGPDHAPEPVPGPRAQEGLRTTTGTALVALCATILVVGVDHLWPPAAGQPLALRWCRVAASHPIRLVLGLLIVFQAFHRTLAPRPQREADPGSISRADAQAVSGREARESPPRDLGSRFFVENRRRP